MFEHEIYEVFRSNGVDTPNYIYVKVGDLPKLEVGKKYVAKVIQEGLLHKSDEHGVLFGVDSSSAEKVFKDIHNRFPKMNGVLFAEQIDFDKGLEILIGAYVDPVFGELVTIGFGGTATDYMGEIVRGGKLTFPADTDLEKIRIEVAKVPVVRMLTGDIRGYKKSVDINEIMRTIGSFAKLIKSKINGKTVEEVESNPIVSSKGKLIALDGVLRLTNSEAQKIPSKPIKKIAHLLNPSSVCIIGASGKSQMNPCTITLNKFIASGFDKNSIYVVHPKEQNINGVQCYPSVQAVLEVRDGKPVDLMIVGVPAAIAGGVIADAFERYAAHSVQVISAGFGETKEGEALQKKLEDQLHSLSATPEKRPIVNGPNTLGNISPNANTLFTPVYKSSGTNVGNKNAALICQSGAFMITAISNLANIIDPQYAISLGNQMDLTVADLLEYLLDDNSLKVFGIYIEGLKNGDGKRMMALSKRALTEGKFVVIYKAGRTKEGADAAKGHTATMAGDYSLFESMMAQGGAIVADTLQEFRNLMMFLSYAKPITKKKQYGIAALSNAGFEKCAIADHLMKNVGGKITLANYSEATRAKIKEIFAKFNITSVVDIGDVLDLTPMMNDEGYENIVRATLADESVDVGLYAMVPETMQMNNCEASAEHKEDLLREGSVLNRMIATHKETKKPFCVSMESGWKYDRFAAECIKAGVPCFRHADQMARVVRKVLLTIGGMK